MNFDWDPRDFKRRFLLLSTDSVIGIFRNVETSPDVRKSSDFDIDENVLIDTTLFNYTFFIFSADAEYVFISDGGATKTSLTRFAPSKYFLQVRYSFGLYLY